MRLEQVVDPRSERGRVYPLPCLLAIAVCALTAAGHDRLTAIGQWIARVSQTDLARLRAPYDLLASAYRVPEPQRPRVPCPVPQEEGFCSSTIQTQNGRG